MKLYVPEIGDRLELTTDWSFKLHFESRNKKLLERFGHTFAWSQKSSDGLDVTLRKGVVLKVDRVYIRQGMEDFSSITFYAEFPGEPTKTGAFGKPDSARFWAKLSDCNKIEFDIKTTFMEKKKPALKWWNSKPIPKTSYFGGYVKNVSFEPQEQVKGMSGIYIGNTATEAFYVRERYTMKIIPDDRIKTTFIVSEDGTCSVNNAANPNEYYHWYTENSNIEYDLFDKDRVLLATFKSHSKMKKFATEYYENNYN